MRWRQAKKLIRSGLPSWDHAQRHFNRWHEGRHRRRPTTTKQRRRGVGPDRCEHGHRNVVDCDTCIPF